MNILVLSWRDPKHPMSGGAEQVMHEHMQGWIEAGHKVTLFSSKYTEGPSDETLDRVHIIRRGRQILGVHLSAFFWYLFSKHERFDMVVDQFHGIPFFTPLYVRSKKVAVIQEVAQNVWLKNQLPFPFNWVFGITGLVTEPLYYQFYKNIPIITGSASAKKDIAKMGIKERNITVIPHGVKLSLPNVIPLKEKVPTIVFLGAIAKDKGIEDALRAFKLLKKEGHYQYWVVGKAGDVYMKEVKKLVQSLGLSDDIHFWGFVDEKKKFDLLARAHIMVNPSAHEGWGLVNIEANSVGTPVVAYPSAGLVDSIQTNVNGVICESKTPEALAKEVVSLLNEPNTLRKLSLSAKEYSKQFTWKTSKSLSLSLLEAQLK